MQRIKLEEVAMLQDDLSLAPTFRSLQKLAASDDECVRRLAVLIENKDVETLDEVARLIERLMVPLE